MTPEHGHVGTGNNFLSGWGPYGIPRVLLHDDDKDRHERFLVQRRGISRSWRCVDLHPSVPTTKIGRVCVQLRRTNPQEARLVIYTELEVSSSAPTFHGIGAARGTSHHHFHDIRPSQGLAELYRGLRCVHDSSLLMLPP